MARLSEDVILDSQNLPQLLYRSDNYLFVSKRHDIKINSDDRSEMTTEHQLTHLFPDLVDEKCRHGFRYANRLDYATSGILCLALNRKAAHMMKLQLEQRTVTKYYLALVRGHVEDSVVFVDVPTGDLVDPDWSGRRCTPHHPQCTNAKDTQTLMVCLERGSYMGEAASKMLLKPFTGRTHQLRVHCDYLGHIIVGDYTYSLRADTEPHRMMLHSHRFITNVNSELLDITSPDPFTPQLDTRWQPSEICCAYDKAIDKAENFSITERENAKIVSYTDGHT